MKWLLLAIVAALGMSAIGGYVHGQAFASEPERLAAYIASQTVIEAGDDGIRLVLKGGGRPYWSYDPQGRVADFASYDIARRSIEQKSIDAESQLLLKWVSGGAAVTVTGTSIVSFFKSTGSKSFKRQALVVLATATGFGVGHRLGAASVDYDSVIALRSLRDKEMIERVKRNVFLSAMSRIENEMDSFPVKTSSIDLQVKGLGDCMTKAEPERDACFDNSVEMSRGQERQKWALDVLARSRRALSVDGEELPDDALLLLFLYAEEIKTMAEEKRSKSSQAPTATVASPSLAGQ